jgi:hypothetical protein
MVTMTVPKIRPGATTYPVVEFEPKPRNRLTASELEQYRAGRDAAIAELGLTALVIEL